MCFKSVGQFIDPLNIVGLGKGGVMGAIKGNKSSNSTTVQTPAPTPSYETISQTSTDPTTGTVTPVNVSAAQDQIRKRANITNSVASPIMTTGLSIK